MDHKDYAKDYFEIIKALKLSFWLEESDLK